MTKPASKPTSPKSNLTGVLKPIVERIEKLEEEKAGIASDIRDIYREAKGNGLDTKTIRKVVADRKLDRSEFDEREFLRDSYLRALGLIS